MKDKWKMFFGAILLLGGTIYFGIQIKDFFFWIFPFTISVILNTIYWFIVYESFYLDS